MRQLWTWTLAMGLSAAVSQPALAQNQKKGGAFAEALFRNGQSLMKAGKFHEACEKFAASYEIDPAVGTLLNLAVCHEKEGRSATAWNEFLEVAAKATQTGQKEREGFARTRAKALEQALLRVAVAVPRPTPGLEVTVDGNPLPQAAWDSEMPLDPGEHRIEAKASGYKGWDQALTVSAAQRHQRVEVPALEAVAEPPVNLETRRAEGVAPGGLEPEKGATGVDTAVSRPASKFPRRLVGYVLDGAGGAMIVGGVISGILAKKSYDQAKSATTTATFNDAKSSTRTRAVVADVLYGAGAVTLGVGLYFTLTSPRSTSTASAAVTAAPIPNGGAVMIVGGY